ncbi:hypothetical protein ACYPKM_02915 [Pseudomonas aeruginosa]
MYNESSLALKDIDSIEREFVSACERLKLSGSKVKIENDAYPFAAATHPYVMLPRLALRAEELSMTVFGKRLFPGIAYITSLNSPSGLMIAEHGDLTAEQLQDPIIQGVLSHEAVDIDTFTYGLRGQLLDLAITEVFDIDQESKLMVYKSPDWRIHSLFLAGAEARDGAGFPLLAQDYLSLCELLSWFRSQESALALNAARRRAAEVHLEQRRRFDNSDLDAGGF